MGNKSDNMPGQSLEQCWDMLQKGDSKSLLKKHLTPTVYNKYKKVATNFGGTLAECIRSGKCFLVLLIVVMVEKMHVEACQVQSSTRSHPRLTDETGACVLGLTK